MAFRSRTRRFSRRRAQKRNLLWIYNTISITANEVSVGNTAQLQKLVQASDWQATFGLNFDRATLLRIVGELVWCPTGTSPTQAAGTFLGLSIQKAGANSSYIPGPNDAAGMLGVDVLFIGAKSLQTSQNTTVPLQPSVPVDVTTKRRLDTDTDIVLACDITQDVAIGVQAKITGILRCLVATE